MIKALRRFVRWLFPGPRPSQGVKRLSPPPTQLIRQPSMATEDDLLAEETANALHAELEHYLSAVKARAERTEAERVRARERDDFLLAMGQAERFMWDTLEFGPGQSHNTLATTLRAAFEGWAAGARIAAADLNAFSLAMTYLLEQRGGHKIVQSGKVVYVGIRLRPQVADSAERARKQHRLGRGLEDLLGPRSTA